MGHQKSEILRRPTRYSPDRNTLGWIHSGVTPENQRGLSMCLIVDVSITGCKVIVAGEHDLETGSRVHLAIAEGPFNRATIKWMRTIDPRVFALGVEYDRRTSA